MRLLFLLLLATTGSLAQESTLSLGATGAPTELPTELPSQLPAEPSTDAPVAPTEAATSLAVVDSSAVTPPQATTKLPTPPEETSVVPGVPTETAVEPQASATETSVDETIAQFLVTPGGAFTELAGELQLAHLLQTPLNKTGAPLTMISCTNPWFVNLSPEERTALESDIPRLTNILNYQILLSRIDVRDFVNDALYPTRLTGHYIRINVYKERTVFTGDGQILSFATSAINGDVYGIGQLLPPVTQTLLESAQAVHLNTSLSYLAQMNLTGLLERAVDSPLTVYLPTNNAWSNLSPSLKNRIATEPSTLRRILLYHLATPADGSLYSASFSDGSEVVSQNFALPLTITGTGSGGTLMVENVEFFFKDKACTNGVLNALKGVMIPPNLDTVSAVLAADPAHFSTLDAALAVAPTVNNALDALSADQTFLALSNAGWALMSTDQRNTLFGSASAMTAFLNAYLLPDVVLSTTTITNDAVLPTVQPDVSLRTNVYADSVYTVQGTVIVSDLDSSLLSVQATSNGALLQVNQLVVASTGTAFDVVSAGTPVGNWSTATSAQLIGQADLTDTYSSTDKPVTFFIPTDEAWAAVDATLMAALNADQDRLQRVLRYGMAQASVGTLYTAGFANGQTVASQNRQTSFTLSAEPTTATYGIDGARIVFADVSTTNGVVHLVDSVPLPDDLFTLSSYTAATNGDLLTLNTALEKTTDPALGQQLDTLGGNMTLWAPNDAAFAALPEGELQSWYDDPTQLSAHMGFLLQLDGFHTLASLANDQLLETSTTGTSMRINKYPATTGATTVQGMTVVSPTGQMASNGILHTLSGVPFAASQTAAALLQAQPANFSIYVDYLTQTDLLTVLEDTKPVTVFAIANDAWAKLPNATLNLITSEKERLRRVCQYTLLTAAQGTVYTAGMLQGQQLLTRNNDESLTVSGDPTTLDSFAVNGMPVAAADLSVTNGVVYVINDVLLPENLNTIAALLGEENGVLTTTGSAVNKVPGLYSALDNDGNYTLFAPNNDAWAALPTAEREALFDDPTGSLRQLIDYYVLNGTVISVETLVNDEVVRTEDGEVRGRLNDYRDTTGVLTYDGAVIAQADVAASNGAVQVLSSVAFPPSQTIAEFLADPHTNGFGNYSQKLPFSFSLFSTIATTGGFMEQFGRTNESLTVLVSTNAALKRIDNATLATLLINPGSATPTMRNQVLAGGTWFPAGLFSGMVVRPLSGGDVVVSMNGTRVDAFDDAAVLAPSIALSNGIVYVVDGVFLTVQPHKSKQRETIIIVSCVVGLLVLIAIIVGVVLYRRHRRSDMHEVEYLKLKSEFAPRYGSGGVGSSTSYL